MWHNNRAERGPSRRKRPWVRHIPRVYPKAKVGHAGDRTICGRVDMALFAVDALVTNCGHRPAASCLRRALSGGAQAADSLYEVAKISVDITAKDAVAAREEGMAEAQMRAVKIVLQRLMPLSAQDQIPESQRGGHRGLGQRRVDPLGAELDDALHRDASMSASTSGAIKKLLEDQAIPYSEARAPLDLDPAARDRRRKREERRRRRLAAGLGAARPRA